MQVKKFIQHLKQLQKEKPTHVDGYLEGELSMINRVISLLYLYSSPSDKINKEE